MTLIVILCFIYTEHKASGELLKQNQLNCKRNFGIHLFLISNTCFCGTQSTGPKTAINRAHQHLPNTVMLLYVDFMEDPFMGLHDIIFHLHGDVLR